ncbi:hypothetical protein LGKMAHEF_02034 [Aeromonas salmonicida]
MLGTQHLVPHQQHGGAHRQQGGHHHVLGLAYAQRIDVRILSDPFMAMIPAEVVIAPVPVLLAVGLVVFVVITGPVPQGETVMTSDEVDALLWVGVVIVIDIRAAAQSLHEGSDGVVIPAQKVAHVIPELAVPLTPARAGQAAYLIKPTRIPGFGDELDVSDAGIRVYGAQGWRIGLRHAGLVPRQYGGQIESKAVHVHLLAPEV